MMTRGSSLGQAELAPLCLLPLLHCCQQPRVRQSAAAAAATARQACRQPLRLQNRAAESQAWAALAPLRLLSLRPWQEHKQQQKEALLQPMPAAAAAVSPAALAAAILTTKKQREQQQDSQEGQQLRLLAGYRGYS